MDEEEEKTQKRISRRARAIANPEKGSAERAASLEKMADEVLDGNLRPVVLCILENILAKHLPSVRLLFSLAERVKKQEEISEEESKNLTQILIEAYEGQYGKLEIIE